MKKQKLLILLLSVFILSCSGSDNDSQFQLPTVTTTEISGVANTTAGAGGTVTDDGGSAVTARGVAWATTENPTTANNKTTDGTGTGNFLSTLTGLTANTRYYARAYATNSAGTTYGNQLSFTTTNVPAPGTTVEYVVDIVTIYAKQIYLANNSTVCQEAKYAEFDMDPYAVSYTVHFYDMIITYPGQNPQPYNNGQTSAYSFNADAGVNVIYAGTTDAYYTYLTNWFSIGNIGAVTRDPLNNRLYCNITWCAGNGVCNGICNTFTGKAKITVRY